MKAAVAVQEDRKLRSPEKVALETQIGESWHSLIILIIFLAHSALLLAKMGAKIDV